MEKKYSKLIAELRNVCNIAFDKNLVDTHSGNISVGTEDGILITKTGRSLINLKQDDFTASANCASSELEVHRFILKSFPASSVFHCHPLNAIALSLRADKTGADGISGAIANGSIKDGSIKKLFSIYPNIKIIKPLDFESAYFFPEIYIFPLKFIDDIKSGKLSAFNIKAGDIFKENGVFMVKSHGSFSWGQTPADALRWTMTLETSSEIILKLS
ncbi:MAG: class II aldolase/adducin family protein [Deltaproteobacteria bacterium]|nr:class II aldolase/adducin family protein [Deltaproteobacteria bacterium]MCL6119862.1 class II aldolase/adducin family protein [Deltaproteobacteria bacterium]